MAKPYVTEPEQTATRGPMTNEAILNRAIGIVRGEKQRWEVATAFVTDRVSFKMRQLIRICRKNYYGIFDQPIDQFTNLEKTWYPLTEINVEQVIKNIDLDQKDLHFKAKSANAIGLTQLARSAVKDYLSKIYFGQKLDDFERMLAIDGTAVWKTYEEFGKMQVKLVDLLNIYIDPTSPSIQEAYRFTERTLMFPEEIKNMKGWMNTANIDYNIPEGLPRTDPYWMNRATQVNSNVRLWDVYELWGQIPKSLITGDFNDDQEEVQGHIVVSGIDSPGRERVHLIELNDKKDAQGNPLKPYEECWFTRVPNRWYGRGIAEKLLTLQVYANIVFNVRINRSRVSQLGLFKMKKGAGVTPQMLARLPANGVITLNNLEDLEQMVVQEVGESSYKDEEVINTITEKLTNAFEVVTGEALPSTTSATEASIQNQNAKAGFSMTRDNLASFLERWMDRHAMPLISKEMTKGEIVRVASDEDAFASLVERVVLYQTDKALEGSFKRGYIPSPQEIQLQMFHAKQKLMQGDLFLKLTENIIANELESDFYVGNEEFDPNITIQNLNSILQTAPQYADQIIPQVMDIMGLPPLKEQSPQPMGQAQPGQTQQSPQMQGPITQQLTTNAMTR